MTGSVLVLGSSGRFGAQMATAFETAGWDVRRFDRTRDNLRRSVDGVQVVVNGWNPAYTDWASEVPRFTSELIAATKDTDKTVIIPGNVYVFGADTPGPWGADTPHRATNPLGQIRCWMEAQYRGARVRTIILRAGDFLDTRASGNWFDRIMIKSLDRGRFTYPGRPDVEHAWAFLPDMGRAAVALAEKRLDLPLFCDVPFPGYTMSGSQIAAVLSKVMGSNVRLKQMNWLPIRGLSPVWPMGRCLLEMRYLWNVAHSLDNAEFDRLLPDFEPTPVEEALRQSVQGAGVATRSTQTSRWRLAASAAS